MSNDFIYKVMQASQKSLSTNQYKVISLQAGEILEPTKPTIEDAGKKISSGKKQKPRYHNQGRQVR
ncbi:MAG: hypothetical protein FWE01_02890 [Firmicutes bacterium]|nr:hypothetical protein [Bacillota bacterium]